MTEETDSVNTFTVLDGSVQTQECDTNTFRDITRKDCECDDENSLTECVSQGTDLDISHEHGTKTMKKVSFSDQVLVYELKNEYKCEKCSETYKDYLSLRSHIQNNHKKLKHYICYYCAKKFVRRDLFKAHIKLHCDMCSLLLSNRYQYLKHKDFCRNTEKHHSLEENMFERLNAVNNCELCKKQFDSKCALKYHISNNHLNESIVDLKTHCQSDADMYKCPYCNESSISQDKIIEHLGLSPDSIKNIDTEEHYLYTCDRCSNKYKTENDLLKHKWSHYIDLQNGNSQTEISGVPSVKGFLDQPLNNTIDIKNGVPDHFNPRVLLERLDIKLCEIKNHRDDENVAGVLETIDDCSSDTSHFSKSSLVTPSKDTNFQCNICRKFYYSSYNLQRHIKTHKKKEKCIFCGMEFKSRNKLNEHKCDKILDIPAADERTVVSIDDLKKPSSLLKAILNNEKPIIVEVRSLNKSYNILKEIDAIKLNKFNIANEVPHFFQPKVLVERMDFDSLFDGKDMNFDDVIDVDSIEDTVLPCTQGNMLNSFHDRSYMEKSNIIRDDADHFILNETNDSLLVEKNICNNNDEEDKTLKPHVGSIRVIKNTTANFIDTMDYQDIYLKSVKQWDNKRFVSSENRDSPLNRLGNVSDVQMCNLKRAAIRKEPASEVDGDAHDGENHDIIDDIPITILKKVNAISTHDDIRDPKMRHATNNLSNKEHNLLSGPPRVLNHELDSPPDLLAMRNKRQKQNNGQLLPGEVFHLQPASMLIMTHSNEMQLQPGYLVRLNITDANSDEALSKLADSASTLNHIHDKNISNDETGLTMSQDSRQIRHVLSEQLESLPNLKSISDHSFLLQDPLNKDNGKMLPLRNGSQRLTPVNTEPIYTTLTTNEKRMSTESRPETLTNNNGQLIFQNACPKLVPSTQENPNTNIKNVSSGGSVINIVNENASKEGKEYENSPSTHKENVTSVITMSYDCKICNRYFHSKSSLTLHLRKVHKLASDYSPLAFICNVCKEAFAKIYNLQRHRCYGVEPGLQKPNKIAPMKSRNRSSNVTTHMIIDLTDSHNASNGSVPNGVHLLKNNPTMQNLNSIDIEMPVTDSATDTEDINVVGPTDTQVPAVSTSTYEFDNYKLILTEVPIEF